MVDGALAVFLGALAGVAIGAAFFAGLWLTVRQVAERGRPRSLLFLSFAVRTVLAVGVLAILARQGVLPLLGALGGFLLSRVVVTRLVAGADVRLGAGAVAARPPERDGAPAMSAPVRDGRTR